MLKNRPHHTNPQRGTLENDTDADLKEICGGLVSIGNVEIRWPSDQRTDHIQRARL